MTETELVAYVESLFVLHRRELDKIQAQHDRELDRRFADNNRAVSIAYAEHDRRLNAMNEVREQLENQSDTFVDKEIFEVIRGRVDQLEGNVTRMYGWVIGVGAAAMIFDVALRMLIK